MVAIMTKGWARRLVLALGILGTIGCDRVTKHIAVSTLAGTSGRSYLAETVWLGYVENTGGFLGLGSSWPEGARTGVFTILTGALLLAVAMLAVRWRMDAWQALGVALFLAGGASNWIDRIFHGHVVDFLNVGIGSLRTGVFNVADMAILTGAALLGFAELRREWRSPSPAANSPRGQDLEESP